ncbi:MAG: hypothetical protein MPJ25_14975 [Pirellulales bacterium]|nr:hypothetical protein [Pirellulales bacterium]
MNNTHIFYRTRFDQSKFPGRKEYYYGVHDGSDVNYKGSGIKLKSFIKKYGEDSFVRDDIATDLTEAEAYGLEGLMVDDLMISDKMCLNLTRGGNGGWSHNYGPKSDEHKRKIGDANRGKKMSNEQKLRLRDIRLGTTHSEETKLKMSLAHKGKVFSEETRKKLSEANKGNVSWQKGIPQKIVTCPHCGKSGGYVPMGKWHFDNCRDK